MVHRIDRVNPDVDDRVIKPNEARSATNLRFGASTDDENLSGGTLFLGNEQLPFVAPSGTNVCVGIYAEYENRFVFFAMYNNNGNHGIYRINSFDNSVQAVVAGSWLRFLETYTDGTQFNVSMTSIDGKLYWTDNYNEPRMVNVEKGIRTQLFLAGVGPGLDVYPLAVEDWHYTQLKRPPGRPLSINPVLEADLPAISLTKQNRGLTDTGFQYSYYYVYDNFEESRLAPYSKNTFGNYNIVATIPQDEFDTYTTNTSLIKAVVIVIRNGNDGVWREIRYFLNDGATRTFTFPNILATQKNIVSSDITDARFDSVPLESTTNEIAQNKINHANYNLDYAPIEGIEFNANITYTNGTDLYNTTEYDYKYKSFMPWGRYSIGVEFVDKFGRTQPVQNVSEVVAPWWRSDVETGNTLQNGSSITLNDANTFSDVTPTVIYNARANTVAEFSIKGDIPTWVDRVNIVRSKCKNIVQMKQSLGTAYLWYKNQDDGNEFFTWVNYGINPYIKNQPQNQWPMYEIYNGSTPEVKYTFYGYVIEFNTFEPITATDNQYIYLPTGYSPISGSITPGAPSDNYIETLISRFKVHNVVGNKIYILAADGVQTHPRYAQYNSTSSRIITPYTLPVACFNTTVGNFEMMGTINNYIQLVYNFVITQEVEADEDTLYTTQVSYSAAEYRQAINNNNNNTLTGYLSGDAYTCLALKTTRAFKNEVKIFNPGEVNGKPIINNATQRINSLGWYGFFISMNPIDIYREQWNQDIGQVNTTNYKDTESRRLNNAICFSNPLVQGSQVNGLNKFNSVDFRLAPAENGPITALVTTNATQREPGVMLAIGSYGISSFYYDAIQLTNTDGSSNVTTTDSYLASQRPLLGQFGTSRPMSITKTPLSTVYWWSDVVNDMVRYSNAGLERLGLTYSFSNFLRKEYNDNPLLITWYDQATDEVLLSGDNVNTSVFSERYKTFQGTREYVTQQGTYIDRAMGVATKVYYIVDGQVWVTDLESNSVIKNFVFGEYKDPNLTLVTNESPTAVKRWNQIKVLGNRPSSTILSTSGFAVPAADTLTSFVEPGWWIERKGDWEAAIRRASNTAGGVMGGKLMESRILYSNFAFNAQGFEKINFIEIRSNVSIVQ
jgi:hypothetical protein